MPPAIASGICGSCGQKECSAQTSAVTGFVASLPSDSANVPGAAYTPRCECVSIRPGVTYLPVPSTTPASAGAVTVAPSAVILPSCSKIEPFGISWPVAVMIVALRIRTGGLGWRRYVDGYCGRSALVVSVAALAGVCAGAGDWVAVAPARAQAMTPASTVTERSLIVRRPPGVTVPRSARPTVRLLHQLEHDRLSDDFDLHDAARRGGTDVKHERRLTARHVHPIRRERPGGDHDVLRGADLEREHVGSAVPGGQDIDRERLPGLERERGEQRRQRVVVVGPGGDGRVVRHVDLARLAAGSAGLIHLAHRQIGRIEDHRAALDRSHGGNAQPLRVHE